MVPAPQLELSGRGPYPRVAIEHVTCDRTEPRRAVSAGHPPDFKDRVEEKGHERERVRIHHFRVDYMPKPCSRE